MAETGRLKIKLVENGEQLDADLWNRAYFQIDRMCTSYELLPRIIYPKGQQSYTKTIEKKYTVLQIFPWNPSNLEEWTSISNANFRCYITENEDQKNLVISPMGSIPNQDVQIGVIGWY